MPNRYARLAATLRTRPFFWLLVPWFFLLKNVELYFTAIPPEQIGLLLLKYTVGACILYFLLYRLFRKNGFKAALACTLLLVIYFFYPQLDDFIQSQNWLHPFTRYRWSIPAAILVIATLLILIVRLNRPSVKAIFFLNLVGILFCLSAFIPILFKTFNPPSPKLYTERRAPLWQRAPSGNRPDIYFILLDEYPGNEGLQKIYGYSNEKLVSSFSRRGFYIPDSARTNYNYTFFSMPSIFNMSYLEGGVNGKNKVEGLLKFSSGVDLMQNSQLVRFLKDDHTGYSITNLSPFLLDDSGSRVRKFTNMALEDNLIESQTLWHWFSNKFGWMIPSSFVWRFMNSQDYDLQFYNEFVRQKLLDASHSPRNDHRFVYAHLFMPHTPFFKDSAGNDVDFRQFVTKIKENDPIYGRLRYMDYVKYTNRMLIATVDTLINNDPRSIIIVMSDHGFRGVRSKDNFLQFNNQFYIRTPDKDYSGWPRTVDAVNVFRILLNTQFGQHLSYLPYRSEESQLSF
jgi:hypothetical protein